MSQVTIGIEIIINGIAKISNNDEKHEAYILFWGWLEIYAR